LAYKIVEDDTYKIVE